MFNQWEMKKMTILARVSPFVLRHICKSNMEDDYDKDSDLLLANDIEDRMKAKLHSINYFINGDDILFEFSGRRQMELLEIRIIKLHEKTPYRQVGAWFPKFRHAMSATNPNISRMNRYSVLKDSSKKIIIKLSLELDKSIKKLIPQLPESYKVQVELDWKKNKKHSSGGYEEGIRRSKYGTYGGVILAMSHMFDDDGTAQITEYNEVGLLRQSSVAGGFKTNVWQYYIMAVFTHEYAHAVQQYCFKELKAGKKYKKEHGDGFIEIYEHLRVNVLNPLLKSKNIKIGK